jgi:hypothetical protein
MNKYGTFHLKKQKSIKLTMVLGGFSRPHSTCRNVTLTDYCQLSFGSIKCELFVRRNEFHEQIKLGNGNCNIANTFAHELWPVLYMQCHFHAINQQSVYDWFL